MICAFVIRIQAQPVYFALLYQIQRNNETENDPKQSAASKKMSVLHY